MKLLKGLLICSTNDLAIIGTPSKERFEGLQLSEAATESNFIRSNGRFIAVRE